MAFFRIAAVFAEPLAASVPDPAAHLMAQRLFGPANFAAPDALPFHFFKLMAGIPLIPVSAAFADRDAPLLLVIMFDACPCFSADGTFLPAFQ